MNCNRCGKTTRVKGTYRYETTIARMRVCENCGAVFHTWEVFDEVSKKPAGTLDPVPVVVDQKQRKMSHKRVKQS